MSNRVVVMVLVMLAMSIVAWLTGDLSVFALVVLMSWLVGTALVAFFDWRAKLLQRQILHDAKDDQRLA